MGFVMRLNSRDLVNDPKNGAEVYPITATNAVYRAGTDKNLEEILSELGNQIDGNLQDVVYNGNSIVSNKVATITDKVGYVQANNDLQVVSFENVNAPSYEDFGFNHHPNQGIIARVNNYSSNYNLVIPRYSSSLLFTNLSEDSTSLDFKARHYYTGANPIENWDLPYEQSNLVSSEDHTNITDYLTKTQQTFLFTRKTAILSNTNILPCFAFDLSIQNNKLNYKRPATIDEIKNNEYDNEHFTTGDSINRMYIKNESINLPAIDYPLNDIKINNNSIVNNKVANIVTNSAYNASSNKIATMNDLPTVDYPITDVKIRNTSVVTNKIANMDVVKNNNTIHAVQYVDSEQTYQSMTKDPNTLYFIPV